LPELPTNGGRAERRAEVGACEVWELAQVDPFGGHWAARAVAHAGRTGVATRAYRPSKAPSVGDVGVGASPDEGLAGLAAVPSFSFHITGR